MDKNIFQNLTKEDKVKKLLLIQELAKNKNISELRNVLEELGVQQENASNPYEPFPMSDMQESFLVGKFYGRKQDNVGCHIYFEFQENNLNVGILNDAWNRIVQHHDMLHAVMLANKTQRVLQEYEPIQFKVYNLNGKSEEEIQQHIALMRQKMSHKCYEVNEWPLFQICITNLEQNLSLIHLSIDEWIMDGFSLSLLLNQWYKLYKNPEMKLPDLHFTFKKYIEIQKANENSAKYKRDLEYLMNKYKKLPSGPELPWVENPSLKPGETYYTRKRFQMKIHKEYVDSIKKKAIEFNVSVTAIILTCFGELLQRWSKKKNFSILTTYFNRPPIHEEIEKVVGPFVSTNIFNVNFTEEQSISEKVKFCQKELWDDLDHNSVSGIRALREMRVRDKEAPNLSIPIVFTSMLNQAGKEAQDSWLEKSVYSISQTPQVCLDHQLYEYNGEINITWDTIEEFFQAEILDKMFLEYESIIKNFAIGNDAGEKTVMLTEIQQSYVYGKKNNELGCRIYQEFEIENINLQRLNQVWNTLVNAHEMLRVVLDDKGNQVIKEKTEPYSFQIFDLSQIRDTNNLNDELEKIRKEQVYVILPTKTGTLYEFAVSLLPDQRGRIHITLDAMIADGKSIDLLYQQLFKAYQNECMIKSPRGSFAEYVNYLEREKNGEDKRHITEYWKSKFANLPQGPKLPYNSVQSNSVGIGRVKGEIRNWKTYKNIMKKNGLDPNAFFVTVYQKVLEKWTDGTPFTIVYVNWDRPQIFEGIDELIGEFTSLCWLNTLSSESFLEQVQRNQEMIHQELQYAKVSGLPYLRRRLMQKDFLLPVVYTNYLEQKDDVISDKVNMGYGFSITPGVYLDYMGYESGNEFSYTWDYDTSVFSDELVKNIFEDFKEYLHNALVDLEKAEWDNGERMCIHERFEQYVSKFPDKTAVTYKEESLTYSEVNARANQLAAYLQRQGSGPEVLIAVCMERSLEMIIAILGILKSGAAYVPIDSHYPEERIRLIVEDANALIVITEEKLKERLGSISNTIIISKELDKCKIEQESKENLVNRADADNIAYVIYTSGSTGKPKGVLIPHHNVIRLFEQTDHWFHFNENDVWTMFHSYAFDFSVWEIWGALLYGGKLVVVPYEVSRMADKFYHLVLQEQVTVLNQTPTAFYQFINADEKYRKELSLRYVVFGGEALNPQKLSRWYEYHLDSMPKLINMYGITETTVHVTYRALNKSDASKADSVIGIPIPDLEVFILDQNLNKVLDGQCGELYISGSGLARGYLNREELTKERFIRSPFDKAKRLYKTGDLARMLPTGDLEYLGRCDLQVKIRGFRIELGDIESALLQYNVIKEAVVVVKDKDTSNPKIVAYIITANNKEAVEEKEIRHFVRNILPDYMVPNTIVQVENYPMTQNGKLDRAALPWPVEDKVYAFAEKISTTNADVTPVIISIMKDALETTKDIHEEDDIFDLGATSLTIMTLTQMVIDKYKIEIPIEVLLTTPVIKEIAGYVNAQLGCQQLDTPAVRTEDSEDSEELENTLISILKTSLEINSSINAEDDIFDLGATSLTIMDVITKVEELYHYVIPIEVILTGATIRSLAKHIQYQLGFCAEPIQNQQVSENTGLENTGIENTGIENTQKERSIYRLGIQKFVEKAFVNAACKNEFESKEISFKNFSSFLQLLKMKKVSGETKYLYPSSGGRNGVQTYIYVKKDKIEKIEQGIYYYNPLKHEMQLVTQNVLDLEACNIDFNQKVCQDSAFVIFFIAQLNALKPVYLDYSQILCKVDAGYMAQLLLSRQAEYKLGLYQLIGLDFSRIQECFDLDEGHLFVHAIAGGYHVTTETENVFSEKTFADYIMNQHIDIQQNYKTLPVYEDEELVLKIQREKKFNVLSKRELVELTKKQPHIRKEFQQNCSVDLEDVPYADNYFTLRSSQRKFKESQVPYHSFERFISLLQSKYINGSNRKLYVPPCGVTGISIYIYVTENGVQSVEEGIYRYVSESNELEKMNQKTSIPIHMCHTPFNLAISKQAKFFVFFVGNVASINEIAGTASLHYAELEAGMCGQVLMDHQAEFGIGLVPIGGMDFEKIHKDFGIKTENVYIHSLMCGAVDYNSSKEIEHLIDQNEIQNKRIYETVVVKNLKTEDESFPLSYGQQSLYFEYKTNPQSSSYNTAYNVRIHKKINMEIFEKAVQLLIQKHVLLRATFGVKNGTCFQIIHHDYKAKINVVNASGFSDEKLIEINKEEYHKPFDLETSPAFRITLFKVASDDLILMFNIHHIITDYTSTGLLVSDLWSFYENMLNGQSAKLDIETDYRYIDFINWQKEYVESPEGEQALQYWKELLETSNSKLELPTDRRVSDGQNVGGTVYFTIGEELTVQYKELAKREKKTLNSIIMAAFQVLLYIYSDQSDISVATTANARGLRKFEGVAGYFINPLVIRSQLSDDMTFSQLAEEVNRNIFSAIRNQNYPFPLIVEKVDKKKQDGYSPFFQVTFQLISNMGKGPEIDKSVEPFNIPQQEGQFDLEMEIIEQGYMSGRIAYNKLLFNEESILRFNKHFINLLKEILKKPDELISDYNIIDAEERDLLVNKFSHTKMVRYTRKCIHQLVEEQSQMHPESIAVVGQDLQGRRMDITYDTLNRKANQLADYLLKQSKGGSGIVGICLRKSIELVTAVLAVYKAGMTYIPIDPAYPQERYHFIEKDAEVELLIVSSEQGTNLFESNKGVVVIDIAKERQNIDVLSSSNKALPVSDEGIAYIIYTSGSTGLPKGVKVPHKGAVNTFYGYFEAYLLEHECRKHLQMANFTFDVFVGDFIRSLCSGGTLVLCPREYLIDVKQLYKLIVDEKVEFAEFVPAVMRYLTQYLQKENLMIDCMKGLVISSDSWNMSELKEFQKYFSSKTRFISAYGVTEASIDSTYMDCSDIEEGTSGFVPIGRPLVNTKTYIITKKHKLAPLGVPGELCIGGIGVAEGYLNRPELNQEKFIADPFSNDTGKMYCTGDLVRYLSNGVIEFMGRIDNQIKIRGLRIELGEVENVLVQYEDVKEGCIVTKKDKYGESFLVGYYTSKEGKKVILENLQDYFKQKLPEYMVPSVFAEIEEFPLNSNGKIDRKQLPDVEVVIPEISGEYQLPETKIQKELSQVWMKVLNINKIGVNHNFFDIGGHSFLAIRLIDEISSSLGYHVPLVEFLKNPTISAMEQIIEPSGNEEEKIQDIVLEKIQDNVLEEETTLNSSWYNPEKILLTGSTGFLGSHLLADIMKTYNNAKVYCLIRGSEKEDSKNKLLRVLERNKIDYSQFVHRIELVNGDLGAHNLGLTKQQFNQLAEEMDIIFHCGAYVNFAYPYEVLKNVNVDGTVQILKLATTKKMKLVHYISTTSVYDNLETTTGFFKKRVIIGENTPLFENDKLKNTLGYTQSKWHAEKVINEARQQGIPVCMYRPNVISGNSKTGVWNTTDFASNTLISIAKSGVIPKQNAAFNWAPVDYVSEAIVYLSRQGASINQNFNVTSPYDLTLTDLKEYLTEAGYPIVSIPFSKWIKKMEEIVYRDSAEEKMPKELLESIKHQNPRVIVIYDSNNVEKGLKNSSIKCPAIDSTIIEKYCKNILHNDLL
ncbi:non-ribosomal peptide synthetase [Anaeromicropila populeti]|uniref:Amino acid adenylation domain-containing protein/thioester reductase domain-containing protein n=1 Tax=Anaeromicropila populeti TaxID=37658 RepID=A0A1I6L3W0_9FIRM|nr:non-ribosomal peptide synthetase [Anaeromicropila populeti]SFR98129.1 amino acid adenylation domain-containing protein/thioester reductase domain-containing protein [Anaeromicropila populeti]